jgi:hypothetical protein
VLSIASIVFIAWPGVSAIRRHALALWRIWHSRVCCTMKRCLSDHLCVEYAPFNFSFVDNKHLLEGSCTSKARGLSMMGMIDQSLNDSFADAMHNLGLDPLQLSACVSLMTWLIMTPAVIDPAEPYASSSVLTRMILHPPQQLLRARIASAYCAQAMHAPRRRARFHDRIAD